MYVDGKGVGSLLADDERPDVEARYGRGSRHGYDATYPVRVGAHTVSVYAINTGAGTNVRLGTRTVGSSRDPIGHLDSVTNLGGGRVRVVGWAIDPNTTAPIRVHLYADSRGAASLLADVARPDLAALGSGTRHGFDHVLTLGAGRHGVTAYAINNGAGHNPLIGTAVVQVT